VGALYTKVKEGSDLSEEGKILAGNNSSGSENSGSELTITWRRN